MASKSNPATPLMSTSVCWLFSTSGGGVWPGGTVGGVRDGSSVISQVLDIQNSAGGSPAFPVYPLIFRIQRRVENETMLGSTLLRLDTREVPTYRLENVKWTQYFTGDGTAIHTNYWRNPSLFGIPASHGCLGMLEKHARWFWDWAEVGTPLNIHP